MSNTYLPQLTDVGLSKYIDSIKKFPILSHEDETKLANDWINHQDRNSAHQLVTSHLRLVVKISQSFKGYGLPLVDVISEGNIGLMQAVKRFDPSKGFRLSTYAMWWIKASINEYVLRSWSLVKMGTTAGQKKLFYNLRRVKSNILGTESRNLLPSEISQIADDFNVSIQDVTEMNDRLFAHDSSLNAVAYSGENDTAERGDFLQDTTESFDITYAENDELQHKKEILFNAMSKLNQREQDIIQKRRMQDPVSTLDELSKVHKVSKERIRQIENRAMEKLLEIIA